MLPHTDSCFSANAFRQPQQLELNLVSSNHPETRKRLTNVLKNFIRYAKKNGSQHSHWYYASCTRMIYSILGLANGVKKQQLSLTQCEELRLAEEVVTQALSQAMQRQIPYKKVFLHARMQLTIYLKREKSKGQLNS